MQKLGIVVKMMAELIPLLGVNSEAGQEVMKVLPKLAKLVPPGSVSPASEKNNLESMMMRNAQQGSQMQQMRQAAMAGGAQPGGAA